MNKAELASRMRRLKRILKLERRTVCAATVEYHTHGASPLYFRLQRSQVAVSTYRQQLMNGHGNK